jgi:DNA anti-recombination protein RmuC
MQNDIIILLVVLFMAVCLGTGSWFFVRLVHELQATTQHQLEANAQEVRVLVVTTQNALAQSQQEVITLRRALASTKGQGYWGEMQLQRIVDLAGIGPYCSEFQSQFTSSEGEQQCPDLQVALPNGRKIIIDANVSIDAYLQAYETLDEATRVTRLQAFAESVRDSMVRLANKEYWKHVEPSPTWVVLLIPNEGMFRVALEYEPTLLDTAIQSHVLLASPITLLALLKAMAYGWQQEKRAGNVQQIVEQSQALHEELRNFVTGWKKLRGELRETTNAFDQCTTIYQNTIFPIVQLICELDGTSDADEYDLSSMPKFRAPRQVLELAGEEVSGHKEQKPQRSRKSKNDAETRQQLPNEGERSQETVSVPLQDGEMLCPACQTPYRENARFCNRCGQSIAETEALPQVESTTEKDEDYGSMLLAELRQTRKMGATIERYRRAVEAIMTYNSTVDLSERWYINAAAVTDLVGGQLPSAKEYLASRRAEIEAHHRKYRLLRDHNRGKAIAITECIAVPDPQPARS